MQTIEDLLRELQLHCNSHELTDEKISKGSVGWHIAHTLLTIKVIVQALKHSDPAAYKGRFNLRRSYVYLLQRIPRGKVRAPRSVEPQPGFTADSLKAEIAALRISLESLGSLSPKHFFPHPVFGMVKLNPAKKFIRIHTQHHLRIIRDIVAARSKSAPER